MLVESSQACTAHSWRPYGAKTPQYLPVSRGHLQYSFGISEALEKKCFKPQPAFIKKSTYYLGRAVPEDAGHKSGVQSTNSREPPLRPSPRHLSKVVPVEQSTWGLSDRERAGNYLHPETRHSIFSAVVAALPYRAIRPGNERVDSSIPFKLLMASRVFLNSSSGSWLPPAAPWP